MPVTIAGLAPDRFGFYHPSDEGDVRNLILYAGQNGLQIRVRGSAHSVKSAIYTDGFQTGSNNNIDVMLDKLSAVTFDDANKRVTVEAGCHLGKDPFDPAGTSTWHNSLFYQIDQRGWAVPDTGGIIHQTVGGFISTGSSGGSLKYSFDDSIIGIRIIDGNGQTHDLTREDSPELFYAAGVSMGLLGIITRVTIQCVDQFNIRGQQATTTYDDCAIDLFGPGGAGKPSLQSFLTDTDYSRLMWWPQRRFDRL
jgi:FAD/FMN-containing dehydrogenase